MATDSKLILCSQPPTDTHEMDPKARPACFASAVQECLFVLSVTMAVATTSILTGSITVISSFVANDLGMTIAQTTWMNAACSLCAAGSLLFFGNIADLFGGKPMLVWSMMLFSVVCLGAGFATDAITLDILCGLLGMLSAAAVTPAQGVLGSIYRRPSSRKNIVFGCFSAGYPLGFAFGTVLSGLFTQLVSWRACFFLISITYSVASVVAVMTVPGNTMSRRKFDSETWKRFDVPGAGMSIAGIGMFCAALSLANTAPHGWKTWYVLLLLIMGLSSLVAFALWERTYPYAIVDMTIFQDRDFTLLLLILSFGFLGFPVFSFWIALYFQTELGHTPLETGVLMLPMVVVGLLANAAAALLQHKTSNKHMMGLGAWAYVAAFALAAAQRYGDSYWAFSFPALCLCVVGADLEFIVANMYVVSSMPADKQSIAGSVLQTLTRLCTALGYGIATSIFEAVKDSPPTSGYYGNDVFAPFAAVFWFAFGASFMALPFLPFLRVTTQGHEGDAGRAWLKATDVERE